MFKLEIKKIALKSVVFSAYPFVVFTFVLLTILLSLMGHGVQGEGFFEIITSILLESLIVTATIVLLSLFAVFIYNTLTNFGLKGLRLTLSEVEEETTSEAQAEAASIEQKPAEQDNENK